MYEINVTGKGKFFAASRAIALSCCKETWPNCKMMVLDGDLQDFEIWTARREAVATVHKVPVIEKHGQKLFWDELAFVDAD